MGIRIIQSDCPLTDPRVRAVCDVLRAGNMQAPTARAADIDVPATVAVVIADVEANGDQAVIDLTRQIEKVELTPAELRVPAERIAEAHAAADPALLELVRRVRDNVRDYQEHILIQAPSPLKRGGRTLGVRYTPLDRVGVCVPGGGGSGAVLLSTMLMTIVPAQVAGVGQIAVVSPPTTHGDVSPSILAIAAELGVEEIYRVSGTAGVAALAIGTESIPAVNKIVGPGNAFVSEAKKQLFGRVGIDSIAGPSEVLIVADETAQPAWLAADLLAQAEHAPGSAVLVTSSAKLARAVAAAIEKQLPSLDRAEAIRPALENYSAVIVVPDIDAACEVANDFAPEHLQVITEDDEAALAKIRNAGAAFLGPQTPVPLGDYYAGPSHVLPTGGTAKFFGPLSCNDFLKATSVIRYDADALAEDADDVSDFANREGLTAHAQSVEIRKAVSREQNEQGTDN